ncbi:hypothetical protein APHAL10511_000834 [Amanita phalloides]|nr:hypothetical protein APHAL10511_000834 [Amanita phalloides]
MAGNLAPSVPKRGPGRPKGSKNKPTAGKVGRPRKDGQPPQKRHKTHMGLGDRACAAQQVVGPSESPVPLPESCLKQPQIQVSSNPLRSHGIKLIALNRPATAADAAATSASNPVPSEDHSDQSAEVALPSNHSLDAPARPCRRLQQPWHDDANVPVRPPSPTIQDVHEEVNVGVDTLNNPYGSDFSAVGSNHHGPENDDDDDDDDEGLEDEFAEVEGDDEDTDTVACDSSSEREHTTRSTIPRWLNTHYKAARDMLKREVDESKCRPPMPKCYEQHKLWVWDTEPALAMLTQPQTVLEPALFHKPTFFVWIPHCLINDRIPCPECKAAGRHSQNGGTVYLQKMGWPDKPRRVVDIDRTIYLIGYRYRCGVAQCNKAYRSWSPSILKSLPPVVTALFPFQLTHRMGLSKTVVSLLQASIRDGIGPGPLAQMIRSFHYQRYDELHLQYLQAVYERYKRTPQHFWIPKKAFGAFGDRDGYAGYVPTAKYFRRFYDMLIERQAPEMTQLLSLLSGRVLAIDHSFKITRRLGKINGAALFTALHSVVNEYGEIRSMLFTMTKGHDQYITNLHEIDRSLERFGHPRVQALFTDNVQADKDAVQHAFPSLLMDIVPVPTCSPYPRLEFPRRTWDIVHLSTAYDVNLRFDIIMNHRSDTNPDVWVAFGMEWPMNLDTGVHGPVALIQIAYEDTVFLIKTTPFLHNGVLSFPHAFLAFMRSSFFKKAGVNISASFKRLQRDCAFGPLDPPFVGQVELGTMALSRGAATRRNVSLVELAGTLLRRFLPKDPQICVSSHWADPQLPDAYIEHAVLNAYAVHEVYQHLSEMEACRPVTADMAGGTPVMLCAPDGSEVAHGIIALERPKSLNGVDVTATRMVITVSKITRRLGKINGAALFTALHSVVNEYGEIRSMLFTMTKGHDQYITNLHEIDRSLERFGHPRVQALFTDNVRADKDAVQHAFPSLLMDIVPVPTCSLYPRLEFPRRTWDIVHLSTAYDVNLRFDIIMNHRSDTNPDVWVAFGMEWPMNLDTGVHGPVALIQIAYEDTVFLIKTTPFLHNGVLSFPHAFLAFMHSSFFKKAGVNISASFKRLQRDCAFGPLDPPFAGQVELGTMALSRGAATRRNVSLVELAGTLLRRFLPKDPQICVSSHWADPQLPDAYIEHAVLNAYAVHEVYQHLSEMEACRPVTADMAGGTPVMLCAPDGSEVAHGIIALERPKSLNGVDVTATRMVITVSKVLVPGFLLPARLSQSKQARPLSDHGQPPFTLLCEMRHLKVCLSTHEDALAPSSATATQLDQLESDAGISCPQSGVAAGNGQHDDDEEVLQHPPASTDLTHDEDAGGQPEPEQCIADSSRDPVAEAALSQILSPYSTLSIPLASASDTAIHSRVLFDNWHCYNQFLIHVHHGLRRPFARALSAAFFLPIAEDKVAVEAVLKQFRTTFNAQMLSKPDWLWTRVLPSHPTSCHPPSPSG